MPITDRIPGLVSGILFCFWTSTGQANLQLAAELLEEGDHVHARSEAIRSAPSSPDDELIKVYVLGVTALSLHDEFSADIPALRSIQSNPSTSDLKARALYGLGRALLEAGKTQEAVTALTAAFQCASDRQIFLRAACSLAQIQWAEGSQQMSIALNAQIEATRPEWTTTIWRETAPPKEQKQGFAPARWMGSCIVSIYRSQIRPVIGRRCNVHPSCSEYFLLCVRKHGILGFPLQADRFFREPDIVMKRHKPVVIGRDILYSDPVEDHDFWLTREK